MLAWHKFLLRSSCCVPLPAMTRKQYEAVITQTGIMLGCIQRKA